MIRTVISDLGRVVLWFDNDIFLRKLAGRSGRPFEDVKAAVHGNLELIRLFDGGALTPAQFYERVTRAAGADIPYDGFYEIYNDIFSLNPPAVDVLARVKAGHGRDCMAELAARPSKVTVCPSRITIPLILAFRWLTENTSFPRL